MFDWSSLTAAFLIGLFSSAHCVGMCGGIMGALVMAIPSQAKSRRWWLLGAYNIGRIGSYAMIGLLAGAMASQFVDLGGGTWLRWLAGLLLIAMGLYLADWWRGLTYLETLGRYLWAYIQPLGKRLMPVDSISKALLLGVVWGWLPCGLVYSALAYAMAQGNAGGAGLLMLSFGLGTLPAVLATGALAQQLGGWLRKPQVRWPLGLAIILFGAWTIWGGAGHHHGHDHGSHAHGGAEASTAPAAHHHHDAMQSSQGNHLHHNHTLMPEASPAEGASSSSEDDHHHHH